MSNTDKHYLSSLITESLYNGGYVGPRKKPKHKRKEITKPDYELKAFALSSGQVDIVREMQKNFYNLVYDKVDYETFLDNKEKYISQLYDVGMYEESLKIIKADYQRKKRLIDRITKMLKSGKCIFLTLTFTDKVLESTQQHVRRKYVQQFLKFSSTEYVGNIDFGNDYNREHYHAVVLADQVNHKLWKYGNLDFERVRQTSSEKKLALYIAKLCNHAVKETARRNHLIYSRKKEV